MTRKVEWLPPPVTGAGEALPSPASTPPSPPAAQPSGQTTTRSLSAILGEIPSSMGTLTPGAAARVLMDLFRHERSGRLVVEGAAEQPGAQGTLFFLRGEPVHAAPIRGDAALLRRLATRGVLKRPTTPPPGEGPSSSSLIARLARNRGAPPTLILEALRDEVRDFMRTFLAAAGGRWSFFDDVEFADHTPLVSVNPFGVLLEERRRALPPDALLRLGEELAGTTPLPRPGFANVAPRLRAFTGHVDLGVVVDGITSSADIYRLTGLDPVVGGLVLVTLEHTGLVELLAAPRDAPAVDRRSAPVSVLPLLVAADAQQLTQLSRLPARGGAEILSLYLELKPESDPFTVLGVPRGAGRAAVERAHEARLGEIDPRAIPPGPSRPYLLSRVEELRIKIERAYRTVKASTPQTGAHVVEAYQVGERIGAGGMAEVFRGHAGDDPNRVVAIKRILPSHRDSAEVARALIEEARLARRIVHPNVVRIFTVGKSGDDLYLAMELVDGTDLGNLARRARARGELLPVDVVCRIVADACGGLHAAHTARDRDGNVVPILHCDVSPQNILVGFNGDVKLTDFGIAKAAGAPGGGEDERVVRGKIAFLAPEIIRRGEQSVRSDVYAMAMTMYAALGTLPFSRRDVYATMRAALVDPLPRLSEQRGDVPPALDAILLRAAARDPAERPPSAQELQLDLEDLLAHRPPVDVRAWLAGAGRAPPRTMTPTPAGAAAGTGTVTVNIFDDVDVDVSDL